MAKRKKKTATKDSQELQAAKEAALKQAAIEQEKEIEELQAANAVLRSGSTQAAPGTPAKTSTALPEAPFMVNGKKYLFKFAKFAIRGPGDRAHKTYTAEACLGEDILLEFIVKNYPNLITLAD